MLACDPYIPKARFVECGARGVDLDALLSESDVISLHCNLTEETRRLIDATALAKMRPTAILVNTARGPMIDETALLESIEGGRLHSAGIDVFEDEPPGPAQAALLAHPRVVPTGHCAWYTVGASKALQRGAAANMAAMLRGETPEDCLNPEAFA